jgi:hypothetical protein
MVNNKTKYIENKYDAVNDFIDEENRYAMHFRKYKTANLFKIYALYASLVILVLAFLILFSAISYWFYKEKPEHIFNTVNYYNTDDSAIKLLELSKEAIAKDEQTLNIISGEVIQVVNKVHDEYVIFKLSTVTINKVLYDVTTGWKYKKDEFKYPYRQYCYLDYPYKDLDKVNIYLLYKDGKEKIKPYINDRRNKMLLNDYDFEEASKKCIFKS